MNAGRAILYLPDYFSSILREKTKVTMDWDWGRLGPPLPEGLGIGD
jgi:hypothetical protein